MGLGAGAMVGGANFALTAMPKPALSECLVVRRGDVATVVGQQPANITWLVTLVSVAGWFAGLLLGRFFLGLETSIVRLSDKPSSWQTAGFSDLNPLETTWYIRSTIGPWEHPTQRDGRLVTAGLGVSSNGSKVTIAGQWRQSPLLEGSCCW